MLVKTITCSGVNEDNDIQQTIAFLKQYEKAEFGVQCSPKKVSPQMPRFEWLDELISKLNENGLERRVALHLNEGFAISFCTGKVPDEIAQMINKGQAIGRLQINYKIGRDVLSNGLKVPAVKDICRAMDETRPHQIIFSASKPNLPLIRQIHAHRKDFDILFDDSFGEGILPHERQKPLFEDIFQGYAGGISPENVMTELDKISAVTNKSVFIDAEGKLKEDGCFSFNRAAKYIENALLWQKQHHEVLVKRPASDYAEM